MPWSRHQQWLLFQNQSSLLSKTFKGIFIFFEFLQPRKDKSSDGWNKAVILKQINFRSSIGVRWPDQGGFPHGALPHKYQPQPVVANCKHYLWSCFVFWKKVFTQKMTFTGIHGDVCLSSCFFLHKRQNAERFLLLTQFVKWTNRSDWIDAKSLKISANTNTNTNTK